MSSQSDPVAPEPVRGPAKDGAGPSNVYALVTYIRDPLGGFLDGLRAELVRGCKLHSHVSVLPPRPVKTTAHAAWQQIEAEIRQMPSIEIEATAVSVFPETLVLYLEIGRGRNDLVWMHKTLNTGHVAYRETFEYYPHITLAQDLAPSQVEEARKLAHRRWQAFPHKRSFPLETLTFVTNAGGAEWVDLARCRLAPALSRR
jgi:2'-5' RNA ligase